MDEIDSIGGSRLDSSRGGGDSEVQRTMLYVTRPVSDHWLLYRDTKYGDTKEFTRGPATEHKGRKVSVIL